VERDPWQNLLAAAGAIGAVVALVYLIGGASLSLRYEGFGLPGHQAATLTPREVLLAAGLRTLFLWSLLGAALVLVLRAVPDGRVRAAVGRAGRLRVAIVLALPAIALLLTVRVWWPLAVYLAALAITAATVYWEPRSPRRLLACAVAVAVVTLAYEADRLSYLVERTCVDLAEPREQVCGVLIGQQDRGFYLGVPGGPGPLTVQARDYRLAFLPAERVEDAGSEKELARVIAGRAAQRREPLRERLWSIRVR
jgi:hypothetical protein